LEVLVRNRLCGLPGASVRRVGANVLEVTIPRNEEVARVLRQRTVELAHFDDLPFYLDGEPCLQALGSGESPTEVVVTVVA
jgi:hypothetical protein